MAPLEDPIFRPGDDLWKHSSPDVVIRVSKGTEEERLRPEWPEKLLLAKAEDLQAVMDKAAREFTDSSRPLTPPMPTAPVAPLSVLKTARRR